MNDDIEESASPWTPTSMQRKYSALSRFTANYSFNVSITSLHLLYCLLKISPSSTYISMNVSFYLSLYRHASVCTDSKLRASRATFSVVFQALGSWRRTKSEFTDLSTLTQGTCISLGGYICTSSCNLHSRREVDMSN